MSNAYKMTIKPNNLTIYNFFSSFDEIFSKNLWIINKNIGTKCQIATNRSQIISSAGQKKTFGNYLNPLCKHHFFLHYNAISIEECYYLYNICLSLLQCAIRYKKLHWILFGINNSNVHLLQLLVFSHAVQVHIETIKCVG